MLIFLLLAGMVVVGCTNSGDLSWQYYPVFRGQLLAPLSLIAYAIYSALCLSPVVLDWREEQKWNALNPGFDFFVSGRGITGIGGRQSYGTRRRVCYRCRAVRMRKVYAFAAFKNTTYAVWCAGRKVLFEGTPLEDIGLREQTAQIGFVMQDPESQIVTDKVWHELAFGLESLGYDTLTIRRRVAEMASYFGIGPWFHRDVRELSGGQKQLLNLAAIMAMQPSVLILDEPTAQLDPIAATDFLETVFRINRDMGTTVLMTEHRLEEVLPMSDRVVIMDAGRIVCYGTPSETGRLLWKQGHAMFLSMPTAMRVSAAASCSDVWPVTVREGRAWLADYRDTHGFHAVPPEPSRPAPAGTPALELDEIWFRYEKEAPDVLRGLSLRVYPGEFLAVMGGNGAGKSTTLSIAAGLRRPYRGHVRIMAQNLLRQKIRIRGLLGVLPQDPRTLFVKKSVREDLQDMLMKDSGTRLFEEVTSRCHVRELLDRHPYDLSGGERQRVALAKILLLEPKYCCWMNRQRALTEPLKRNSRTFFRHFYRRAYVSLWSAMTSSFVQNTRIAVPWCLTV